MSQSDILRDMIREGCSLCGRSFDEHGCCAVYKGAALCLDCAIVHGDPEKRGFYEWRRTNRDGDRGGVR